MHGTGIDHRYIGGRARTVLIDTSDALRTAAFDDCARQVDIIFKQMTGATLYPTNCCIPWAFGLSEELCRITPLPWECRKSWIEVNHRNQHPTRLRAETLLGPKVRDRFGFGMADIESRSKLELPEELTMNADESGNRHRADYMHRLSSAKVCLTAGGYFTGPRFVNAFALGRRMCNSLYVPNSGRISKALGRIGLRPPHFRQVYQWDSWRFWETMALGTVSLTYDLHAYRVRLPVMPVNWVHYVGLDFGSGFEQSCAKFMSLSDRELASIGDAGRRWAIENYSPRAVASRLLGALGS